MGPRFLFCPAVSIAMKENAMIESVQSAALNPKAAVNEILVNIPVDTVGPIIPAKSPNVLNNPIPTPRLLSGAKSATYATGAWDPHPCPTCNSIKAKINIGTDSEKGKPSIETPTTSPAGTIIIFLPHLSAIAPAGYINTPWSREENVNSIPIAPGPIFKTLSAYMGIRVVAIPPRRKNVENPKMHTIIKLGSLSKNLASVKKFFERNLVT